MDVKESQIPSLYLLIIMSILIRKNAARINDGNYLNNNKKQMTFVNV